MVEFFGRIEENTVRNGNQVTVFEIPAFSQAMARRRASANARVKDLRDPEIDSIENIRSTDVPGQNLYEVTVLSRRV